MTSRTDPQRSDSVQAREFAQSRNPWVTGMFKTAAALVGVALVVDVVSLLGLVRPSGGYASLTVYVALGPISSYCWTVGTILVLSAAIISAIRWHSR